MLVRGGTVVELFELLSQTEGTRGKMKDLVPLALAGSFDVALQVGEEEVEDSGWNENDNINYVLVKRKLELIKLLK